MTLTRPRASTFSLAARCARACAAALFVAVALPSATGCRTNEATGRSQLLAFDRSQEIAIGEETMPQLVAEYGGESPDPDLRAYITEVGASMVPYTEADNPNLPWQFTLLDSDVINAFALPGGKVFMSRGLAERMTNEAQLASVLGHEIGHVTARHTSERVARAMGVQALAGVAGFIIGQSSAGVAAEAAAQIVGAGGQGYLLKYGRDQELEADRLGIRYMVRAGYDPRGLSQTMRILAEAAEGAARPPEFLSTHPHPESRVEQAEHLIRTEYAFTQNNPEFRLNESAFRQRFLQRVALLPPPRHSGRIPIAALAMHGHDHGAVDFDDPMTWCGVCRANASR